MPRCMQEKGKLRPSTWLQTQDSTASIREKSQKRINTQKISSVSSCRAHLCCQICTLWCMTVTTGQPLGSSTQTISSIWMATLCTKRHSYPSQQVMPEHFSISLHSVLQDNNILNSKTLRNVSIKIYLAQRSKVTYFTVKPTNFVLFCLFFIEFSFTLLTSFPFPCRAPCVFGGTDGTS